MAVSYKFDDNGNEILPEPKSISWINEYIKSILEQEAQLQDIYVSAEISNFKYHTTGHMYFTLKDEQSEIRAVMFKTYAMRVRFKPENGMKVLVHARIGVYEKSGSYQLYVSSMQPEGIGSLYLAFEQLKEKLSKEGLFNAEFKKQLPKFPKTIGIITSPTGAAVRDIIKVAKRRWPFSKLLLFPSAVQGASAPGELIRAVEYFNMENLADVIIIGRGGGSIEDLWGFNDEGLARAIFNSKIPIISAVGHEIDFTICDFVADVRAATPSHAAEIATPDALELKMMINSYALRINASIKSKLDNYKERLGYIANSRIFKNPQIIFEDKKLELINLTDDLITVMDTRVNSYRTKLATLSASLNALSPLSVLSRGYGAVYDKNGTPIKSVSDLEVNDNVQVRLSDGSVYATVNEIKGDK